MTFIVIVESELSNGFWRIELKPFTMLFSPSNLQSPKPLIFWNPILHYGFIDKNLSFRRRDTLRLAFPISRYAKGSESIASSSPSPLYSNPQEPSISSQFTSSVGQPPLKLSQWTFTQKHFVLLNVVACVVSLNFIPLYLIWLLGLGFDSNWSIKIWTLCQFVTIIIMGSVADSNFSIVALLCCNSYSSGSFSNILLLKFLINFEGWFELYIHLFTLECW